MAVKQTKSHSAWVSWVLRVGLAFTFLYAAVGGLREPDAWIAFVPAFTTHFIDAKLSLDLISGFQILLAGWLLSGKYLRYAALVSAALIGGIVVFNLGTLLITFRDVGLTFMALALFFLELDKTKA